MRISTFVMATLLLSTSQIYTKNKSNDEPKNYFEQKLDEAKQAAKDKAKKEIKKQKEKIKKKLHLSANLCDEQDLDYVATLLQRCDRGELEAFNEACDLFEVHNIFDVREALFATVSSSLSKVPLESLSVMPCGKYIGDDGLEYDDGIDEGEVEELSFYSIPIHQWEKKIIEKIVTSLAEKSLAQLLVERKEMEKRGDQVRHVHPLRFMGHVFHEPYLKACLPQFRSSTFKWSNFIDGFVQRMREEASKNNVNKHLEGFCDYLGVDLTKVAEFVEKGQFEDLIYYLMEV